MNFYYAQHLNFLLLSSGGMRGVIGNFFCLFILPSKFFFKIKRENATTFYQYAKCSFFSRLAVLCLQLDLRILKAFQIFFFFTEL